MELNRNLGLVHLFSIAAGAMISSGIFVLPGIAYAEAGPSVIFAYLLAGLLAATGLFSTAELATAMPKAGSDYFFITRGLGPAVGTIAGVLNWVAFSLKSAFSLVGLGALIALLVPVDLRISGVVFGLLFVGANLAGVKEAARIQSGLVCILLALMVWYIIKGFPFMAPAHFTPFMPRGYPALFSTAGLVFVSYGGLLKVASVAEEVRLPGKTIPQAMILSLVLVGLCYAGMVAVTVGLLAPAELRDTLTPITLGAQHSMGPAGVMALGLASALAFLTTANAGILAGSRYLLAMSRDGMLPGILSRVSPRFHTPAAAIAATGLAVLLPVFVDLYLLVEAASIGLILTNMFALLSVIVLRESGVQNYRPAFRAPLYPWLQIAGLAGFSFILLEMREDGFTISALLALLGFCIYWFYGRKRMQYESALLHLVQRLTDKELVSGTLEAELKEIIRERDEIALDRFDHLLEQCPVLDLPGPMPCDAFFEQAAASLAPRVHYAPEKLAQLLRERERESSTVLSPDWAIPHLIAEGAKDFEILVARCRAGVEFNAAAPQVRAVIIMLGNRQERNFHLRCLAAIAQIAQSPGFMDRWLAATSEQGLRDVLLLTERQRQPRA